MTQALRPLTMQSLFRPFPLLYVALMCTAAPVAQASWPSDARAPTPHAQMQPVVFHLQQLPGLSTEHMATTLRRRHLSSQKQHDCSALDRQLPVLKLNVRRAPAANKPQAKEHLQQALVRFAALRC